VGKRVNVQQKKKTIYDGDDPEPEDRIKFKGVVSDFIFPALIDTTNSNRTRQATHALCLLLQASPDFGIYVINYVPGEAEEKEKEKKQPKIRVMNDDGEEEEEEEEDVKEKKKKKPTPNALARLIAMAASDHKPTKLLGARCLAFAASDTNVRTAVAASGYVDVFYSLLATPTQGIIEEEEDDDDEDDLKRMTSSNFAPLSGTKDSEKGADWLAGVHAALALGKLAAVGHITPNNSQRYSLVSKMMELIPKAEKDKDKGKEEKKSKNKEYDDEKDTESKHKNEDEVGVEILQYAVETLAYLSLHIYVKKLFVTQEKGDWHWRIVSIAGHSDPAVRFGVIQIMCNLTTSAEDLQKEYDTEIEALRKVAQKGLPGHDAKREEEQAKKAGAPKIIKIIRKLSCEYGSVHGLSNAHKAYSLQYQELKKSKSITRKTFHQSQ